MPVLSPRVRGPQSENIPPPGHMDPQQPSPSTSRHFSVLSSPNCQVGSISNGSLDQHDDAAELKARRRSRVLELQRQRLASSPSAEGDRSRATPLSTLTNAQVAEHYRNCIKLSAENKINAKNAFGLHLIDYMSELIKKKELNNFQVASSTLDASAKIYAGRVDAIHSDMFKVLGGLGQQKRGAAGDDVGEDVDEMGEATRSPKASPGHDDKKRKRRKGVKKIKANVKTITMDSYNLEFEVDPLFKKTSATFDEGGTGGLLFNTLHCADNQCELVLDSQQTVVSLATGTVHEPRGTTNVGAEFKQLMSGAASREVCPPFSDFTFTNWSSENEQLFKSLLGGDRREDAKHAFDPNAEPEPVPNDCGADGDMDGADEYDLMEPDVAADSDNDSTTDERLGQDEHVDKEAHLVNTVMQSIKHGNISELTQVLAGEQNDYSHFSASVLNTWAGPGLWKMKAGALIKNKLANLADTNNSGNDKTKRKRKAPSEVDLSKEVDFSSLLKESRAATTVKEARLNEYSKSKTTLPVDLRVEADEVFKRGLKDGLVVRKKSPCEDVEDGVANYDYDNSNDANNFCAAALNDSDEHDDSGGCSQDSVTHEFQITQDIDITRAGGDSVLNSTDAGPMALVEQPRRAQRLEIDYARTAKKIDVKKLKSSMWQLMTNSDKRDDERPPAPGEQLASTSQMDGQIHFSDLVQRLPDTVPKTMSKNLSTPICFVCLLHLANEKQLSIEGNEDMTDFTVSPGS